MNPWEKGILYASIGVTAALLAKLWATGLVRTYKLFFGYLVSDLVLSVAALVVPYNTTLYARFYFVSQTLKILIAAFMLMEIYGLALERHPALARFGRGVVGYLLLAAGTIPVLLIMLDKRVASNRSPSLRAFFSFEQTMDAAMAIFLILMSIFMTWFPVRMRRNVIAYISGFIVWTLSRTALTYLIRPWIGVNSATQALNITQMSIALGCLVYWLVQLQKEGESRTAVVGHLWNRAEAERLTEQLNAINDSLERFRRR